MAVNRLLQKGLPLDAQTERSSNSDTQPSTGNGRIAARGEKYRVAVLARTRTSLAPIAQALREAAIPFRAVDLEKLAPAPKSSTPWPWPAPCSIPRTASRGLAFSALPGAASPLPTCTSSPAPTIRNPLARPFRTCSPSASAAPQRSRAHRCPAPPLHARLLPALAPTSRPPHPAHGSSKSGSASAAPIAATQPPHANLDLLVVVPRPSARRQQDLLGPALDAALEQTHGPARSKASTDCGVQLMTIHKSKGLEFEVVIVPDLQAKNRLGAASCFPGWSAASNLKPAPHSKTRPREDITEFLIAPLQPKGDDRGKSKAWVDRVYRERESQETRRILYVAATRARDELHLFARPTYKVEANGDLSLIDPSACLLAPPGPRLKNRFAPASMNGSSRASRKSTHTRQPSRSNPWPPPQAIYLSCRQQRHQPPSPLYCVACHRITLQHKCWESNPGCPRSLL
jgi:ATP-dependent helicase/nuclease subunit A